jgi:hypothetical protein
MKTDLVDRVRAVQDHLVRLAQSRLETGEIDDLRCVIRLTVEFHDYLKGEHASSHDSSEVRYISESIFAGLESFCNLTAAFRLAGHAPEDAVTKWDKLSQGSLNDLFAAKYREFS